MSENTNRETFHQMGSFLSDFVQQATGRKAVSETDGDWVTVGQNKRWLVNVYTGDVIQFEATEQNPLTIIAPLAPVQDLNGYDYPWPAGGSVNLIPDGTDTTNGYVANQYLTSDGNTTQSDYYYISEYFPVTTGENYTGSIFGTETSNMSICFYDSNKDYISGYDFSSDASFTVEAPADAVYARASQGNTTTQIRLMFELGSTPSEEYIPYSNICPITGWDEVKISRTGENLLNRENSVQNYYLNNTGVPTSNEYFEYSELIPVDQPKLYISFSTTESTSRYYRLHGYNAAGEWLEQIDAHQITTAGSYNYVVSIPSGVKSIRFSYAKMATNVIIKGCREYSISFPNPPGTVYGGSLTVNKDGTGTLVVNKGIIDLGDLTWGYGSPSFFSSVLSNAKKPSSDEEKANMICSMLPTEDATSVGAGTTGIGMRKSGILRIYYNGMGTDASALTTAITGQKLVYELDAPVSYTLTVEEVGQIIPLEGTNYIWSDTGDITVLYDYKGDVP